MTPVAPMAFVTACSAERLLADAQARLDRRALAGVVELLNDAEGAGAAPDACSGQRWMAHMLTGDFEAAWRENDRLRARGATDPHRFWMQEDLCGQRVILRCLHGFGDTVQMLRYVPQLRSLASALIIEVPPRFLKTTRCFAGTEDVRVVTWGEGAPHLPPAWDVQVEVMELPYLFRTSRANLPLATEYLSPHLHEVDHVRKIMQKHDLLRIGFVWSAGEWDPDRSVPLHKLHRLLKVEGCEFWSLQGGSAAIEWDQISTFARDSGAQACRSSTSIRDAAECGEGICMLAAVISQMDLVITVDTLAAHLAGAIGVPAWVMLQHKADWRWMTERDNSPWYPTLRMFRQSVPQDWDSVVSTVEICLRRYISVNTRASLLL